MEGGAQGLFPEYRIDFFFDQPITKLLFVQCLHLVLAIESVRQGDGSALLAAAPLARDVDGIADEIIRCLFAVMQQKIQPVVTKYALCSVIQYLAVRMQEQDGSCKGGEVAIGAHGQAYGFHLRDIYAG